MTESMALVPCCGKREHSVRDAIECIGYGRAQAQASITACFMLASSGAIIYGAIIVNSQSQCDWYLKASTVGLLDSMTSIGTFLASQTIGYWLDIYGRRRGLLLTIGLMTFFQVLSAFSPDIIWLMFFRLLMGLNIPRMMYINTLAIEFLPEKSKGLLILTLSFYSIGSGGTMLLGAVMLQYVSWRYYTLLVAIVSWIAWLLLLQLPESPFYLAASGNWQGALNVLRYIAKTNNSEMPHNVVITSHVKEKRGSFLKLFDVNFRRQSFILPVVFLINAWLYGAVMIMVSEDMKGIFIDRSINDVSVLCKPCRGISNAQIYNILSSLAAQLLSIPVSYFVYQHAGGRLSVILFTVGTTLAIPLLTITGPLYMLHVGLVQLMTSAVTSTTASISPAYFPTYIRGTAAGLIGVTMGIGQTLSASSTRWMLKEYPYILIAMLFAMSAASCILLVFLPSKTVDE